MKPIRIINNDMFNIKINKDYKVYLMNTKALQEYPKFFNDFMNAYIKKAEQSLKKLYVCIDCEFNSKKIALIQINFEEENDGNIFIIDPRILSSETIKILKEDVLCNSRIAKIFHGADSLDIPYFFYEFFDSNPKLISKFMNNFIDTRFLCEYNNAKERLENNSENNQCNIYYLYETYKVINKEHREILDQNELKMGKLYDIIINIDDLSDALINYTMYDVVYLKMLYKRMIHEIKEYRYVNEIVQLVYLDKRDIIKFVDKENIDKFNINFFIKNGDLIRMTDTVNEKNAIFKNEIFNTLYHVNYFKQNLTLIMRNIIYAKILRREKVFENKSTKQLNTISYNDLFDKLKLYKMDNLLELINKIDLN
jgi:hypothetical protein